jgi:hypothetical protein
MQRAKTCVGRKQLRQAGIAMRVNHLSTAKQMLKDFCAQYLHLLTPLT